MFQRRAAFLLLLFLAPVQADAPPTRHGIGVDLKSYPQATPKETLVSVLKAVETGKIEYLAAQLADPDWVDERVKTSAGGFLAVAKETREKLDAPTVKRLKKFLDDGEFETLETTAVIRLKDVKDRVVRLRKIDTRWYLLNSHKP